MSKEKFEWHWQASVKEKDAEIERLRSEIKEAGGIISMAIIERMEILKLLRSCVTIFEVNH